MRSKRNIKSDLLGCLTTKILWELRRRGEEREAHRELRKVILEAVATTSKTSHELLPPTPASEARLVVVAKEMIRGETATNGRAASRATGGIGGGI